MNNPYLDEINELKEKAKSTQPVGFRSHYAAGMEIWQHRRELAKKYAWAIPDETAIHLIAELEPIVEIGAGTGYWAWLLRQCGVHIKPYDRKPGKNHWVEGLWTGVIAGGPRNAKRYPDHALMLCWPLYDDRMAFECLSRYTGDTVVYIGEGSGGCTGDDKFHAMLYERFAEVKQHDIPKWWGLHDSLEIWRRK